MVYFMTKCRGTAPLTLVLSAVTHWTTIKCPDAGSRKLSTRIMDQHIRDLMPFSHRNQAAIGCMG